jgi:hypothetical protein
MKNKKWIIGLFGKQRKNNNKFEFVHTNSNKIIIFDTKKELEDYLQEYFIHQCELSSNS